MVLKHFVGALVIASDSAHLLAHPKMGGAYVDT